MNNLEKILRFFTAHKNLTLCLVFVCISLLFFGNTHFAKAGGPEEKPMQTIVGATVDSSASFCYNMGYKFTPLTNGYIDKLWYSGAGGSGTIKVYNAGTQAVLATASITPPGLNLWTSVTITPLNITTGTDYIVAVATTGGCGGGYYYMGTTNITTNNITVYNSVYDDGSGTAFPSNNGGGYYYGTPDISFHTGTAVNYNLTSSQSGNFNVGTTWGGACASSCVAGTDYPGTSESVIIASGHTVTLTGAQTVAGMTINSGGTLSLGSNTLSISGSGNPFVRNGTFTPGTGTIQYTNATSATVTATTYYNLTTGGTGTYTLASGTTTVTNSATISSGATLSLGSNTLVLSGSGTPLTTTGTFAASTGTIQYTNATSATVTATTYYNLTLGGTGTYTMPASTITMKGSLVVANGATITKGAGTIVFSGSVSQTITDNNGTKQDIGAVQVSNGGAGSWCNISSSACNSSWLYRRKITFDNSASSSNLTNFPILVSLTSSNVDYSKTQNNGEDIRFVDADGATALSYEIEKWDETGTSLVWVKVPQIDSGSTTDYIYMYYGNVSATDNQAVVNTWSAGYTGVWHLKDGNTLSVADSIAFNTATNNGATATTGLIDGGANFSGTSQSINLGNSAAVQATTGTASVWIKTSSAGSGYRGLIVKQGNYGLFLVDNALVVYDWNYGNAYSGPTLNDNSWHYVTFVFQSGVASGSRVYVDGVASGSAFTWNPSWNTTDLVLGAGSNDNATQLLTGKLDEARVANTAKSADWIKADYLTGNNAMNNFGSEESNISPGVVQGSSIKVTSLTVDSSVTFNVNGANTLTLTGNNVGGISPLVVNGIFTSSTGTVDFSSASTTGTTIPSLTYYNLTVNKASNTFTAPSTLAVNNLTITAGTFTAPSGNLTVNGDFSNSGTFTHNNGTVVVVPTASNLTSQIIGSSNTTFYNFTNTTVDSKLKFKSGNTYTFTNTFTVTGTRGHPIWITSDSGGSQWTVTFSATPNVNYVNVADSACSGGVSITTGLYQISNQGNNGSCWGIVILTGGIGGASGGDAQGNTSGHSAAGGSSSGNTGALSAGTFADDSSTGNTAWGATGGTLNSAGASADSVYDYAILDNNGLIDSTHYLKATNFGFSVPQNSTINGIVVEIKKYLNQGDLTVHDVAVRIIKGGSIGNTDRSNGSPWPQTNSYVTHGSSSDLWGETWTSSDINNSNFGIAISAAEGSTGSYGEPLIDHVRITVYYSGTPNYNGGGGGGTPSP